MISFPLSYSRQVEHAVSFNGYSPEESEMIKSLKKAVKRNEIKLLYVVALEFRHS